MDGTSNVLTKIAGCCSPTPGQPIGGYVTVQGGGVSIHRRDCANLHRLAALRPHEMVIEREDKDIGRVAVHFPRAGYQVRQV